MSFPNSRCLGPDSRCFPALFGPNSRCFPAVFPLFFGVFKVLWPKRTKKQNFQEFCPKQWVLWPKRTNFSDFYPNQVKTDKKNQFFRNLAQNRSKRTKRQNFQKSCFEKVKTHQKTHFSDFVCKTVRLQSKHTNKTKFSEILARQRFAVKACKTNKIFGIKAPKQRLML